MKDRAVLIRILKHFYVPGKLIKTCEECSELIKVCCKILNTDDDDSQIVPLIEEIADVEIMIDQLKINYDIEKKVDLLIIEGNMHLFRIIANEFTNCK